MDASLVLVLVSFLGTNLGAEPPETWKENWFEHTQLLTRQYRDDDIAVYFDPDVDKNSSTWIYAFFHDVWVHAKRVYGKFGSDPLLYGVFHAGKYSGCHSTTYFQRQKSYRNVVDCGQLAEDAWKFGRGDEYNLIAATLSFIIQGASHGVNGNPVFAVSGHYSDDIIIYDMYLNVNRTQDALRLKQYSSAKRGNALGRDVYWFRDWFLPIYQQYGGSRVLNRFLELVARYFPKSNTASFGRPEYVRDMNYGEFFHFWSAATGRNLKNLVVKVFGWGERVAKEFQRAREQFPQLTNYYDLPETWQENWYEHKELLTKHFSDDEVAVYFDKDVDQSSDWMEKLVRDVWVYVKKVYGKFGNDPIIYAIFHTGKHAGSHASTFLQSLKSFRNVIDCGTVDSHGWTVQTPELVHRIVSAFAKIPHDAANGIGNNPAFHIWGWQWDDIFAYDVYLGLNLTDLANRYYDIELNSYANSPKPKTYWFRDWFVPIYEDYGESGVLSRFFQLLARHFPKDVDENGKPKYSRGMNFGEFVHFWSGAAQNNLKGLAVEAFGWNQEHERQFRQAAKDFPDIMFHNIILH